MFFVRLLHETAERFGGLEGNHFVRRNDDHCQNGAPKGICRETDSCARISNFHEHEFIENVENLKSHDPKLSLKKQFDAPH